MKNKLKSKLKIILKFGGIFGVVGNSNNYKN
jgi:hypothetical protein